MHSQGYGEPRTETCEELEVWTLHRSRYWAVNVNESFIGIRIVSQVSVGCVMGQ